MRRSFLIGVAIYFVALLNIFAEVQVGDSAEQVEQTMGAPMSRGKVGSQEMLTYKNGTIITIKDGVVTDVSVRGRITIGAVTKVVKPQTPTNKVATAATTTTTTNKIAAASTAQKSPPPTSTSQAKTETAAESKVAATTEPTTAKTTKTKLRAKGLQTAATTAAPKSAGKSAGGVNTVVVGILIGLAVVSLGVYACFCYCCKLICQKAGHEPGAMIWIPIAQCIPLLRVAKLPVWMLVFLLIPIVNGVFGLMLWGKICTARNKSPWLAALLLIPVGGFFLIPYLAFTAANEGLDQTPPVDAAKPATDSAAKTVAPESTENQPPVPAEAGATAPEQPALAS